jgi:hypothetical protein
MYYATSNDNHKANAMDILCYINTSLTYARLLDNVQHPANQNIYLESKKMGKGSNVKMLMDKEGESGQKSS